ncbi:ribonuclease E activity regulator RraA [Frateuria aurantia]
MSSLTTCDLCDAHEDRLQQGTLQILQPDYPSYGGRSRFAGPVFTLKVFEDNALVRSLLEQPGLGRVLVVDGGASHRCALVGGNLADLAARQGWAGVLVHGCVRDRLELEATDIGIRALGLHPRKSVKRGQGEVGVALHFAGVRIRPGDWLYADEDGILIAAGQLPPG